MKASRTTSGLIRRAATVAVAALIIGVLAPPALAALGTTERVSVASDGTQANESSSTPSISADGRFVAFGSGADNLVSGDSNFSFDVFVHDRQMGATERVSVATGGAQAIGASSTPSISADGRFVAFQSDASPLITDDTNDSSDILVHDRETDVTERISVTTGGAQSNGDSSSPSISADGRFVAFESGATNLVIGDGNNLVDIFVHDRDTGATERVSVATGGTQGNNLSLAPSISADGDHVAFHSLASNLVTGDSNDNIDVFAHDRSNDTTERVSVTAGGAQANSFSLAPSISADGDEVAFFSFASNLVVGDSNNSSDVFVRRRVSGDTTRVSVATGGAQSNAGSSAPSITSHGHNIAFVSLATNLVTGDSNDASDVFVHDSDTGDTTRVSVASGGTQSNGTSSDPSITPGGDYVAFTSSASNLVAGDSNDTSDIFFHDPFAEPDTTPPETTITAGPPNNSKTSDATPTFEFISSEIGSTFECRLDSESFAPCSGPGTHTPSPLSDGPHSFEVQATDGADNTDESPAERSFTVDTDPPQTSIRGPQKTTNRRPTFRLGSDEPGSTFTCKLDGRRYQTCTSSYRTPRLALGQHVLRVKAIDGVGNTDTTPAKKSFKVEKKN